MPSDDDLVHRVRYAPEVFLTCVLRTIDLPKVSLRFRLETIKDCMWLAQSYLAVSYGATVPPSGSADRILADTLDLLTRDLRQPNFRERLLCAAISCTRMRRQFDDLMRHSMTASVLSLTEAPPEVL